jgi:hypothetical protein
MQFEHWPPIGRIWSLKHDVQTFTDEHVLHCDEHDLQVFETESKKVLSGQAKTHLDDNLIYPEAHSIHWVGMFWHDLHVLSQAIQIPLNK